MTVAPVDAFTPLELVDGYIAALEQEHTHLLARLDAIRDEWAVLEDRAHQLARLRDRHVAARDALTPPATLTDLVDHHGDVVGVAATT